MFAQVQLGGATLEDNLSVRLKLMYNEHLCYCLQLVGWQLHSLLYRLHLCPRELSVC